MTRGLGRRFWLLYTGESTSAMGTAATAVALPVVALRSTGDVRQAGMAGAALSVGIVLARLPAGVVADRYDRRLLSLAGNTLGVLVLASLALLTAVDRASLPVLLAAAFLVGTIGSALAPVENVTLRTIVQPDLLPSALALIQTRAATAMVAGPLAGMALLGVNAQELFAVDACAYLVSVVCMALLPAMPAAPAGPGRAGRHPLRSATEGIRFIVLTPFLRYAAVNAAMINVVFNGLIIVIIASTSAGTGAGIGVGIQTAALGAGAFGGSLIAASVARRLPPAWGIALGTAVVALALSGFTLVRATWAAAIPLAVAAAAGPVITVVISTVQIGITPNEMQGRVHSGIGFLAQAVSPLGSVLAGLGVRAFGLTATVSGAALAVVLLALAGGLVAARQADPTTADARIPVVTGRG
ncbi:MFS transporter [Frankia sp. ACN1ag]|uniref:MFS transporter n=1 Tax=Frankia sp. ACN1ag TaxID=102891 RepID=UPI000AD1662D|nr:MFS transporter [Frankia sp. ACN1ag]